MGRPQVPDLSRLNLGAPTGPSADERERDRGPERKQEAEEEAAEAAKAAEAAEAAPARAPARDEDVDLRLQAFVDKYPALKTLCTDGTRTPSYINQAEARAAFDDPRAQDPSAEAGSGAMASTKITTLRGIKVVVKKHCRQCGQDLEDESIDNAYWEDQMHRYVWGAVAQRASEMDRQSPGVPSLYSELLQRLSVPGCMKWAGLTRSDFINLSGKHDVYTVQAFAREETDGGYTTLMSLQRWLMLYAGNATRTAVQNICKAYGETMATVHSLGLFHGDLHYQNVLVYYNDVDSRIANGVPISDAEQARARNDPVRLRIIDWGFSNGSILVPGADGHPQYCKSPGQFGWDETRRDDLDAELRGEARYPSRLFMPGVKVRKARGDVSQRTRYTKHESYITTLEQGGLPPEDRVGCRSERPGVLVALVENFGNRPNCNPAFRTACGMLKREVVAFVHDAYRTALEQLPAIQPLDPKNPGLPLRPRMRNSPPL
jgi:hypothetical protein